MGTTKYECYENVHILLGIDCLGLHKLVLTHLMQDLV